MNDGILSFRPADARLAPSRLGRLVEAFIGRILTRVIAATCPAAGAAFRPDAGTAARAKSEIRRILIARFDGIGDIILTVPLLRALKTALPDAEITFVTRTPFVSLIATCPYIDNLVGVDPPRARNLAGAEYLWPAIRLVRHLLRDRRFDVAISPRVQANDPFAVLILRLSGAGDRIGFAELTTSLIGHAGRFGLDRLLTVAVPHTSVRHEVEHSFSLLRTLDVPPSAPQVELWPDAGDWAFAETFREAHAIGDGDLVIALAPGCGDARRTWAEDRYIEVCQRLIARLDARIVVVGGPEDLALAGRIGSALDGAAAIAVGKATLRQTAALLGGCRLFIGNDSGPMHIAAAMAVPVVEISCHPMGGDPGHTNSPARFGPWQVPQRTLRPPPGSPRCDDYCRAQTAHCILGISTAEVVSAALSLLSRD